MSSVPSLLVRVRLTEKQKLDELCQWLLDHLHERIGWCVLTQRSPEVLRNSIIRRLKARNQSSYEFFLLHVGGLALRHKLVTKPDFEIRVLYCRANQRFRDWEANKLLSYEQVEGTHETLLNRQYLPTIVPKIVKFFEG